MELTAAFTKTFPGGPAIHGELELGLGQPGITVLFGPSGCGKTTVLRCLAGLERPEAGAIRAGSELWFHGARGIQVPAPQRRVGLVFQEGVLFPHLTVAGNLGYGLHGLPKAEARARVAELAALMGLEEHLQRRPRELSGGQKQRVALARALAPRPRLVLLDEPFASLDRAAAEHLRHQLRQILQALAVPAVLVTHNPLEALALGDRMVRMDEGRVLQAGAPATVLSHLAPESLGAVVRAQVLGRTEGLLRLDTGGAQLFAPDPGGSFQEVYACIRGEGVSLEVGPHGHLTQRNSLASTITAVEPLGPLTRIRLDAGFPLEALITTWACGDLGLAPGQRVQALVKASAIQVVPIER